jgi:aspartyl-tRNA(Asn)/glutamyl-tRNA(Gln) amidotransferase subunit A
MGLAEIAAAVVSGASSAEAETRAALARIAAVPELRAFVAVDEAAALAAARAVDARVAAGARLPLAGVTVGVKDTIRDEGLPVAQGSRLFAGFHPPRDAVAVARLRRAGAVILGMTNAPEFACKGHTDSPLHGAALHPQDRRLTPGGSSGGSAVAVAAGLVPLALGTDAGGSIRRPAANVGICGFKPGVGVIPQGPGFDEAPMGVSVVGPMAATVADIRRAFAVLAGPDPADPESAVVQAPARPFGSLRLAWSPRMGLEAPMDEAVAAAMEAALDRAAWRRSPEMFDPLVGAQVERGFAVSGIEVARGLLLSQAVARAAAAFFGAFDLLLGPVAPCTAWPVEQPFPPRIGGVAAAARGHAVFTPLFNHARTPALSLPAGYAAGGLPVGLHLVAARGEDRTLLAAAARIEAVLAGAG